MTGILFLRIGIYHRCDFAATSQRRARIREDSAHTFSFKDFFSETFVCIFFANRKSARMYSLFILLYRLGEAQLLKMSRNYFLFDPRAVQGGLAHDGRINIGWIYGTAGGHRTRVHYWRACSADLPFRETGVEILAVADAAGDSSAGRGFYLARRMRSRQNLVCDWRGRGHGAIRLRLRFHGVHALPDFHCARRTRRRRITRSAPASWRWALMLPMACERLKLQEHLGYPHFFVWVILATIPSFVVATQIPLEAEWGKRNCTN
jgi:PAT family beta-lactamase induction signal transducer AmpG